MMKLQSARDLPMQQQLVWRVLNDVEVLRRCIPGCESLASEPDGSLVATVVAKIGPVSAKFGGRVAFEDVVEPVSYRLVFNGQGGAAGFAKGHANVRLEAIQGGTRLHYTSEASIGGKLAQIGSRLVEGAARKLADDFFSRLEAEVQASQASTSQCGAEAVVTVVPDAPVVVAEGAPAMLGHPGVEPSNLPSWLTWGSIGALVLIVAGYFIAR